MKLETKDLLTGDEISNKEFLELIDFSIKLKEENKMGGCGGIDWQDQNNKKQKKILDLADRPSAL